MRIGYIILLKNLFNAIAKIYNLNIKYLNKLIPLITKFERIKSGGQDWVLVSINRREASC